MIISPMAIEDVFSIKGRGTVCTGRIERGIVKVGDQIEIVGLRDTQKTTVTGVEMFNKTLNEGQAGDNVGCLLRGVEKTDLERGQVLAKPGGAEDARREPGHLPLLEPFIAALEPAGDDPPADTEILHHERRWRFHAIGRCCA